MRPNFLIFLIFFSSFFCRAQYEFEPSEAHPFGLPNPKAPKELLDFAPMIGECDCSSQTRNPDQTWQKPVAMVWRFKYIMNGMAVQDETLKEDDFYAGSIRQFIADSSRWYVHYYNARTPAPVLPSWKGGKNKDGKIVLYRDQKAPNGMEGWYRITFYAIDAAGFRWIGEWVPKDESFAFPTWKIDCKKRTLSAPKSERDKIMENSRKFSEAYISADYDAMANAYTADAKIFPGNAGIITGREAIKNRWTLPEGVTVLQHRTRSVELKFIGDYAYDYGYYEGKTKRADKTETAWKGKYVIVWRKEGNDWKMYLDIWNNMPLD
ncbi:MAG: DUF4440 domain-containing protein [Sinomicrobium sp.]|nr:DUF4440 domain-containing protein [Sinomicrobium sp.]